MGVSDNPNRQRFESAYEGKPPWDLGRPQRPFIEAGDQIKGAVLDVGCGTGDNALHFARRGQSVLGIDFAESAIAEARRKAEAQGVEAEFLQLDVLGLKGLGRQFDSVIDCGLFHVLSDEDRGACVAGLAHVTRPGGRLFLMCFSDQEPGDAGPRRIRQDELQEAFARDWTIESVRTSRFEVNPDSAETFIEGGPKAWFAIIRREHDAP